MALVFSQLYQRGEALRFGAMIAAAYQLTHDFDAANELRAIRSYFGVEQ
jgi:hypothetical protein